MKPSTLLIIILFISLNSKATTWDEPWQKEIIEKSEHFIKGEVIESSDTSLTIKTIKSFSGEIEDTIKIDSFFMLDLCSMSAGHGAEFHLIENQIGYLFLKKGHNGNYQIPTPTSGFDIIVENNVHATFRHTYHQALVPVDLYEMIYPQIWNRYHSSTFDSELVIDYINAKLKLNPAGFEESEISTFFEQHIALETAYLCDIDIDPVTLNKFIQSDNFHSKVSALRAISINETQESKEILFNYINDKENDNFTIVIAIWSLWDMSDNSYQEKLIELKPNLPDEGAGFGGNIMDPRVCTHFPSPQNAISELMKN